MQALSFKSKTTWCGRASGGDQREVSIISGTLDSKPADELDVTDTSPFNECKTMPDQNGPTYFVVFQSPGPKWVAGVPYNEQPEFWDHVKYMEDCHAKGKIVLSGPFME